MIFYYFHDKLSDIIFPDNFSDREIKKLINLMLSKNPLNRLGKFSHIKAHPCFKNFQWDNLISLDLQAPYSPKLKHEEEDSIMLPYVRYIKVIFGLNI
jgi:serine/threonine protein kinase